MYFSKRTEFVGRGKRKERKIWKKKGFLVPGITLPNFYFFFFKVSPPRDLDYLENILKKKNNQDSDKN